MEAISDPRARVVHQAHGGAVLGKADHRVLALQLVDHRRLAADDCNMIAGLDDPIEERGRQVAARDYRQFDATPSRKPREHLAVADA